MPDADYQMSKRDQRLAGLTLGAVATDPRISRRERNRYATELNTFPAFRHCTRRDLRALVARSVEFSYPANWAIVSEATPADACSVILNGQAKEFKERGPVGMLGRGDIIGEFAFLAGLRPVTVTTFSRVSGLQIDNSALQKLFDKRPQLRAALRDGIAPLPAARTETERAVRRGVPYFWWTAQIAHQEADEDVARRRVVSIWPWRVKRAEDSPEAAA